MKKRNQNGPFICKDERSLVALKYWLKDRPRFNVVNDLCRDKTGRLVVKIGFDTKPDGDFGDWIPAGVIICESTDLHLRATKLAEKEIRRRASEED